MTENEAIDLDKLIEDAKVLAKEKDTLARTFRNFKDYGNPKSTITSGAEKAQKEAEQYEHISKLFEELKAYRAIGTIDQINEVIHFLDLENDNGLINDMTLLNQYRAIGTVEEIVDGIKQSEEEFNMLMEYLHIGTIDEVKALEKQRNNGWIPVEERLPDTKDYILLSFSNFTNPVVGRYEAEKDGSGAFYIGDESETCLSQDLFVNAWQQLPEPYKEGE